MNTTPVQTLSDMDASQIMDDISSLVLEVSLAQLFANLDEPAATELETYIVNNQESETLIDDLVARHPELQTYIDESLVELELKAKELTA